MAVMCFNIEVAYFPVPKVACTSIKLALFEIDHGYPIYDKVGPDPENHYISWHMRNEPFRPDGLGIPKHFARIAVVRDPIQRFVSGYRNRIVHAREAAQAGVRLPADPDIDTFARRLPEYMTAVSMIGHHFAPQIAFVGNDLGWYDRVFSFERLSEVAIYLSERAGRPISLRLTQNSGPALSARDISPQTERLLRQYYADDYALFQKFPGLI